MSLIIILGAGVFGVLIIVILMYGRSKEKSGEQKIKEDLNQSNQKIRRETDEYKRKTKNSSRDDFLNM